MDLPTTTPPVTPTPEVQLQPKTPTSKGFYWLVGTLVAVILAGIGTWAYVSGAKTTQPTTTTNGSTQSASTPAAATTKADKISAISTTTSDLANTIAELDSTLASITSDSDSNSNDDKSNL